MKELNMQLHQLARLLENSTIGIHKAYYIIFSDYPTVSSLNYVLDNMYKTEYRDSGVLYTKLIRLIMKLNKEQ